MRWFTRKKYNCDDFTHDELKKAKSDLQREHAGLIKKPYLWYSKSRKLRKCAEEEYERQQEEYKRRQELERDILLKYVPEEIERERIKEEKLKVLLKEEDLKIEIKREQRKLVKQDRRRSILTKVLRDKIPENDMDNKYFAEKFDKIFAEKFDKIFAEKFEKSSVKEFPDKFAKTFPPFAIFFAKLLANIVLEDDDIKFDYNGELEEIKKHYIVRKIQNIYNVKILSLIYNYFIRLEYMFNPKFNSKIKGVEGEKAFTYIKNRLLERMRDLDLVYTYTYSPEKIYVATGGKSHKSRKKPKTR
jgi:hypothetical protein